MRRAIKGGRCGVIACIHSWMRRCDGKETKPSVMRVQFTTHSANTPSVYFIYTHTHIHIYDGLRPAPPPHPLARRSWLRSVEGLMKCTVRTAKTHFICMYFPGNTYITAWASKEAPGGATRRLSYRRCSVISGRQTEKLAWKETVVCELALFFEAVSRDQSADLPRLQPSNATFPQVKVSQWSHWFNSSQDGSI